MLLDCERPAKKNHSAILAQRTAEGALVVAIHLARALLAGGLFERRLVGPRRVRQVAADAAREHVAAALGDGVDDAAGEAAVFGGHRRGQDLRFLDRFFDEQIVGTREQVVADVDAVEQEHVVVGDRARDGDLVDVRRVVGEAGRELGDQRRRAAGRQRLDLGWCGCSSRRARRVSSDGVGAVTVTALGDRGAAAASTSRRSIDADADAHACWSRSGCR